MSHPDPNLQRQPRSGGNTSLLVIAAVTLFAVLVILFWLFESGDRGNPAAQGASTTAPVTTVAPEVTINPPAASPDAASPAGQPAASDTAPEAAPESAPETAPAD